MAAYEEVELFAWIGEDELGSGEIGLKQALVPAGMIPIVAVKQAKVTQPYIVDAMEKQAAIHRKRIRLCRFVFKEVLQETSHGD